MYVRDDNLMFTSIHAVATLNEKSDKVVWICIYSIRRCDADRKCGRMASRGTSKTRHETPVEYLQNSITMVENAQQRYSFSSIWITHHVR